MTIDSAERERRRALLTAHFKAENENNLSKILATFASKTEMIYNQQIFADHDSIGQAHAYMGFSGEGAFSGLHNVVDREHFTDDDIVIEGRLRGVHRGEFQGYPPTNREVELPFVSFYRFDEAGKLVSERVVMNLGSLAQSPAWQPR